MGADPADEASITPLLVYCFAFLLPDDNTWFISQAPSALCVELARPTFED